MSDKWKHRAGGPCGAAVLLSLMMLCGGCQTYNDVDAFVMDPDMMSGVEPYTLAPPDAIRIESPQVPELDGRAMQISPDGTVLLPLVGQVYVAGKTPTELAAELEDRALEYYQEAEVLVHVTSYESKHLYVFGEVGRAGKYAYTGGDTLLDVLADARPTRMADEHRIHIFRRMPDQRVVKRITVDFTKWYEKGITERNALLAEGDIIYVPPHGFARVAQTLDTILLPVQPIASTIRSPKDIDDAADEYADGDSSSSSSD